MTLMHPLEVSLNLRQEFQLTLKGLLPVCLDPIR